MATRIDDYAPPEFWEFRAADEKAPEVSPKESIVKPMILSHGTLGVIDIEESAKFYTEFLGLDCVRHVPFGMMVRKGGYWSIVCLEVGERTADLKTYNHWGLDVASREEVDRAHELAIKYKDKYGIRRINKVYEQHGDWAFKMQDRDGNWWEIQHVADPMRHDKRFAEGHVTRGTRQENRRIKSEDEEEA